MSRSCKRKSSLLSLALIFPGTAQDLIDLQNSAFQESSLVIETKSRPLIKKSTQGQGTAKKEIQPENKRRLESFVGLPPESKSTGVASLKPEKMSTETLKLHTEIQFLMRQSPLIPQSAVLQQLHALADKNPQSSLPYQALGLLALRNKENNRARNYFQSAQIREPHPYLSSYLLARILFEENKRSECRRLIEKEMRPENPLLEHFQALLEKLEP